MFVFSANYLVLIVMYACEENRLFNPLEPLENGVEILSPLHSSS